MDFSLIYIIIYIILISIATAMKINIITIKKLGMIGILFMCLIMNKFFLYEMLTVGFVLCLMLYSLLIKMDHHEYLLYQIIVLAIITLLGNNLVQIFLALEIINFISITLIPLGSNKVYTLEAALKYFLISAISGALFILGAAFIYGETTSNDLLVISTFNLSPNNIGPILIIISLFIKLGIAPFHAWMPDAYEGAKYKTFIFISLFPKVFLLILLFIIYQVFDIPQFVIYFVILLSGFIGSIQAIFQQKTKRFLSFTMILNNIFLIMPLIVSNLYAVICTFVLYFLNNILTLSLFLERPAKNIRDIISFEKPIALIFICSLFSAIGVPPFLGFFIKFLPMSIIVEKNLGLIIFVIFFSVLAAFYYLRLISVLFFYKYKPYFNPGLSSSLSVMIAVLIFFLLVFFYTIFIDLF